MNDPTHILDDRRIGLEEAFFVKHNRELTERLRKRVERESKVLLLGETTRIEDREVLEELVDLGITTETIVALGLVPILRVAWADGRIHGDEREAVLKAAAGQGIREEGEVFEMLSRWLDEGLSDEIVVAWEDYIRVITEKSSEGSKEALKTVLLGLAERVAESAGGFLGVGRIAASERRVLDELAKAFS